MSAGTATKMADSFRLAAFLFGLVVAACAGGVKVEPDRTTYPRYASEKRNIAMPLIPGAIAGQATLSAEGQTVYQNTFIGRPTLEFEQTRVGDSAEHERTITPRANRPSDEKSLRVSVPEAGQRICGERYRVVRAKYYIGKEATSQWAGIPHPWLSIVIRCPVDVAKDLDPLERIVADASVGVPEAEYFDIHQKKFAVSKEALRAILRNTIKARGMEISAENQTASALVFMTDRRRSGVVGFPRYEQLIAAIESRADGAALAFRLTAHYSDFEGLSDASGPLRLVPLRRDHAYDRAGTFLGELTNGVEKR